MKISDKEDVITLAYTTYKENYLKWVVLELFVTSKPLGDKEILDGVIAITKNHQEVHWEATARDIDKAIHYLVITDLINIVEGEEKATATEKGVEALRSGTYQNLANSSLFGYKGLITSYQGLNISEKAYQISKKSYWIAIFAVFFSLATLVVTLLK